MALCWFGVRRGDWRAWLAAMVSPVVGLIGGIADALFWGVRSQLSHPYRPDLSGHRNFRRRRASGAKRAGEKRRHGRRLIRPPNHACHTSGADTCGHPFWRKRVPAFSCIQRHTTVLPTFAPCTSVRPVSVGRIWPRQCRRSNRPGNSQALGPAQILHSGETPKPIRGAEGITISGKRTEGAPRGGRVRQLGGGIPRDPAVI